MDRSHRDKKSKLDKVAEYKRAREGGTLCIQSKFSYTQVLNHVLTMRQEEDDTIYDEVTEDQY